MNLRYEFDDYGGYDGLAGAFRIYDIDSKDELGNDKHICTVDQYDYDDPPVLEGKEEWEHRHSPWPECEAIAKLIVDAVNEKITREKVSE